MHRQLPIPRQLAGRCGAHVRLLVTPGSSGAACLYIASCAVLHMPMLHMPPHWVQLPGGLRVSTERMQARGKPLSLRDAFVMDISRFNDAAAQYDISITPHDPPIDRLIKYSLFLCRRDHNGSFVPDNAQYVHMALAVADARARGSEPLASFYGTFKEESRNITSEILDFAERLPNGKYKAIVLRFNTRGELEPRDEIVVAGNGWTRVLGASYLYPIETSQYKCAIENLDDSALAGMEVAGYWNLGSPPVGEQRLVFRRHCSDPWDDGRLLDAEAYAGRSFWADDIYILRLRADSPRSVP